VFRDEAYTSCLHGIDEVQEEVVDSSLVNAELLPPELKEVVEAGGKVPRARERISLTVRRVPRVIRGFMQLGARR